MPKKVTLIAWATVLLAVVHGLAIYFGLIDQLTKESYYGLVEVILLLGWAFWGFAPFSPKITRLGAEVCVSLGLLGTVIGFSMMLVNHSHGIEAMLGGAHTALYTTAVGLSWAILLRIEGWILGETG